MDRIRLAKKIHQTAKDKGWWDDENRNHDEIFMLMITELAEAVEADRNDLRAKKEEFIRLQEHSDSKGQEDLTFKSNFKRLIKDSLEDELADTYIRALDYLFYRHREYIIFPELVFIPTDNFAANIFNICRSISDRQIKDVVIMIEHLAVHLDIDLEWHVKGKMQFNNKREYKHGGKKY